MTPDEQRKIIGRFQTAASKPTAEGATLKKAHEEDYGDNTAKRVVVNEWVLDPNVEDKFGKMIQAVSCTQQITKREKWLTQLQVNALWTDDEQQAHNFGGKHHGGWGLPNVKRGEGLIIMFHVRAKFSMMHGVLYFCAIFARLKLQGL